MLKDQKSPVYISGDAFRTFARAIYLSIDNRDIDTFTRLNGFIYDRLSSSFVNDNIKSFEQFSGLFVWYYEYALNKLSSSITYKDIYDICADRSARGLKEKMGWWFRFYEKSKQPSLEDKRRMNEYSRVLLNRYAEMINICLRKKDISHLNFIINELQQSSGGYRHEISSLKFDILFKKKSRPAGEEAQALAAMQERYKVESFVDTNIRVLLKATLFWCFFLFQMNVLSADELRRSLVIFQRYKGYLQSDLLEDLIFLRSIRSEHEYAWGGWDYMERMSGVTYSPPTPNYWAALGAVLYSLQYKSPITIESEDSDPDLINATEYLLGSMIDIAKGLRDSGYQKWGEIIGVDSDEKFKELLDREIERFTRLKNTAVTSKEKLLADIPLDVTYVQNFKDIMIEGWEKGNDVRTLFEYFHATENVADGEPDGKVFELGNKNEVLMGYKTSLVRDDQFFIPIYGIEKHGESLADIEETLFLSLFSNEEVLEADQMFEELDRAVTVLEGANFNATVILCGYDLWHERFQDLKTSDFVFDWNNKQGYPFSNFGGTYKQIPIIYFRSFFFNNMLVVASFKEAFALQQIPDANAYKNILRVGITEISQEKAESIIEEKPAYWKNLSQEEAVVKLRNSVLVDFYLVENFLIKDKSAFIAIRGKQ
ncbi:MAG: hypothetical protein WCF67_17275 [Chitinophagaceae bacterium]